MSGATKAALVISLLLAIPIGVLGAFGGVSLGTSICLMAYILVVGFVFFWFVFKLGETMWKGEKEVWKWLNGESEPSAPKT